MSQFMVYNFLP